MVEGIEITTTVNSQELANTLAKRLVNEGVAACVQVMGPISSTFFWKGAVQKEQEWLLLIKTRMDLYPEVSECIKKHHPYEIPEIFSMPMLHANPDYLRWINEVASKKS